MFISNSVRMHASPGMVSCSVCGQLPDNKKLENVAIVNALQLEAARATPALFRFNYDEFDVAEPIHCIIIIAFCC